MYRFGLWLSCFLATVALFLGTSVQNRYHPINYPGYFMLESEREKLGELTGIREVSIGVGYTIMSVPKGRAEIIIQSTVLTGSVDRIIESGLPLQLAKGALPESFEEVAIGNVFAVGMGLQPGMNVFMGDRQFRVTGLFAKTGTALDTVAVSPGPPPPDFNPCYYLERENSRGSNLKKDLNRAGVSLLEDPFQENKTFKQIWRFRLCGLLFGSIFAFIGG